MLQSLDRGHGRFEVLASDAVELCNAVPSSSADPELCAAQEERLCVLRRVLAELRPERRDVLILSDALGRTVPEIADELGIKPNTVKSRLGRARRDFRAVVRRLPPDERGLLEKSPLTGLLLAQLQERHPAPEGGDIATAGILGGLVAMLGVGLWLGPDTSLHLDPTLRRTAVAVREATPTEIVATATAASPATSPSSTTASAPSPRPTAPRTGSVPPPRPRPTAARTATAARAVKDDPLVREMFLIEAAGRALDRHAYADALAHLDAHVAKYPHGALTEDRERIRQEVVAAMKREQPPSSALR